MYSTTAQQSSNKGLIISTTIHLLLFLLLFFIILENPRKQDAIEAVILDFGDSEEGTGGNSDSYGGGSPMQNMENTQEQTNYTPPKTLASVTSAPVQNASTNTVSSYDAEAIAIEKQKKIEAYQQEQILKAQKKLEEQKQKEAAELLKKQKEEQAYKDAVANSFKKGKNSNTGGNGNGTGSGNGLGNGSGSGGLGNNGGSGGGDGPGGGGLGGSGGGTGTDYSLSGRSLLSKKVPYNNSQQAGKIVIQIKVGKDGSVLFAKGPHKGSTSTDAYLVKISEEAAYKFKFSANSDAAEEQFGTITFNYTFN